MIKLGSQKLESSYKLDSAVDSDYALLPSDPIRSRNNNYGAQLKILRPTRGVS